MNGELGVVRSVFGRAEIVEVRHEDGIDWGVFRVPIGPGDQSQRVVIADSRAETVAAAKEALEVSAEYYRLRGNKKRELEDRRVETLRAARAALNSGCADAMFSRIVIGGGRQEKISFALFPCDDNKPERTLALVHTTGRYNRHPIFGDERALHFAKGPKGRQYHYDLHMVVAGEKPIYIWQLDPHRPVLFYVSLQEGLTIQAYQPQVIEEEHLSQDSVAPGAPATEATKQSAIEIEPEPTAVGEKPARGKKNGNNKVETECSECGQAVTIKAKELTAGKAKCPHCEAKLTSEE